MKKWYSKLAVVLVIGFLLGGAVVAKNTDTSLLNGFLGKDKVNITESRLADASTDADPSGVADMVQKAGPAVVNIETKIKVNSGYGDSPFGDDPFFRQFFGDEFNSPQSSYETGIGTGFLISSEGYILTNQHVIDNATQITVKLEGNSNPITAKVVGQDYELDLAVLKIDGSKYPTLPMGDSNSMRVGDAVVAIGEPYGLDHTVTTGVVSAKGRPVVIENRNYKNLIQTDAAINPGNSGGPLLNMKGQVIAINTAVNSQAQGIGFAIPINTAKDVLNQLVNEGKVVRPYLGVSMLDLNQNVTNQLGLPTGTSGVLVAGVMSGSPAAKAGLQKGDIIVKINGNSVNQATDIQKIVESKKVGDTLKLSVNRDGKSDSMSVTLQEKP